MTTERDSAVQTLFDVAKHDLAEEPFVTRVMSQVDNLRRRTVIGWIAVGLVLVACAWLLAAPVQDAVQLLAQALSLSLFEVGDRWIANLMAPINSVAGLVGLGLLGLMAAVRKIFS